MLELKGTPAIASYPALFISQTMTETQINQELALSDRGRKEPNYRKQKADGKEGLRALDLLLWAGLTTWQ